MQQIQPATRRLAAKGLQMRAQQLEATLTLAAQQQAVSGLQIAAAIMPRQFTAK